MRKAALVFGLLLLTARLAGATGHSGSAATGAIARASAAGAHLDTDLLRGGGTDDTKVLQGLLDGAAHGKAVHLLLDGPALVSGLDVYGNTTIECTGGGGLYLKDGAARAILRNAHRSRGAIFDEHIEINGCFLNGNRKHQPSAPIRRPDLPQFTGPSNKEKDGTYLSGLQFMGVNYLRIVRTTIWSTLAFGAQIANASYVTINNVIVDDGGGKDAATMEYAMTDGFHFKGPIRYLCIDSVRIRVGDDGIALNPNDYETNDVAARNDFGPYVGQGPMTDISINNVQLMETLAGVRLLSANERIDRVVINNVVGIIKGAYFLNVGHWMNPDHLGNIGKITVDNVNVDRELPSPAGSDDIDFPSDNKAMYGEANGGDTPLINISDHIETLVIHHVATNVTDTRPLLRMGPDADVGLLDVDLSAYDPALAAHVVQLDAGSRIQRFNFALDWRGRVADEGKNPFFKQAGTITQLQWIHTPPLFVAGELHDGNTATVTFTEDVKAVDPAAGVRINVNGRPAHIVPASRQGRADALSYVLQSPIHAGDTVTWAYNAQEGNIQNYSGEPLFSVSEKKMTSR